MKIIYKQPKSQTVFENFGIENCYLKQLNGKDIKNGTKKEHHHTGFEVHIMEHGFQTYMAGNKKYKVNAGNLLIIPPKVKHCFSDAEQNSEKISATFNINETFLRKTQDCVVLKTPERIKENIKYILEENKNQRFFSPNLTENRVFEIVALLLRECGFSEVTVKNSVQEEDVRLSMAKKYIRDNIEFNLKVYDVAKYCYLSTKQLTRLFKISDDITPAEYIRKKKVEYMESLMNTSLSIAEISQKLKFSNQYNFHLFFKKHIGMTPGEYKKMLKK